MYERCITRVDRASDVSVSGKCVSSAGGGGDGDECAKLRVIWVHTYDGDGVSDSARYAGVRSSSSSSVSGNSYRAVGKMVFGKSPLVLVEVLQ